MTLKDKIQQLYFNIQERFDALIESCSDKECFNIGFFPIESVKQALSILNSSIYEFNKKSAISGDKPIDISNDICSLLNKIPDLIVLYPKHKSKAETIHNDFCQKEIKFKSSKSTSTDFTDEERNLWNKASSFLHNTEMKQMYSDLQHEIEHLKRIYCKFKNAKPWLKIKPGYAGKENCNVIEFCNSLVDLGYFDQANANIFKKLLLGDNISEIIIWLKLPVDVCRVIMSIRDHKLLVSKPQWSKFEKRFIIDEKQAVDLKSAAPALTSDANIEGAVKKSFQLK